MDQLPAEIIELICAYAEDSDPEDLSSLSLVNHRFHRIVVPLIYETLNVRFSDYESLERIVTEVKENPHRQQFLIHARRLNLMAMPETLQRVDEWRRVRRPDETFRTRHLIPNTFDTPGFFLDKHLRQFLMPGYELISPEPGFYKEKNWEPLLSLISSMKCLKEIHYILSNMFPKCLLDVIHEYHPTCQLSVWGWQRLGLREPGFEGLEGLMKDQDPQFEDSFEMDLLRSPCLHAISFYFARGRLNTSEYVAECIFPLIQMAPNLKHVLLRGSESSVRKIPPSNQRWEEHVISMNVCYTATLTSLDLCRVGDSCAIAEWMKSTDFSSVRALAIPCFSYSEELTLGQVSRFPRLEYLRLSLETPFGSGIENFKSNLRSMLANLKPLKYLHVCCSRDTATIHEIFTYHGRTLRGFIIEPSPPGGQYEKPLHPILSNDDLKKIASQAPNLEELRLVIGRSQGDKTECQLYEALGKFSALRSLVIDLDCNPPDNVSRHYNNFPQHSPELVIKDVYVNAAMDETLARAIWDVILSSGGERLKNLRISIVGAEMLQEIDSDVVRHLAHSFLISRSASSASAPVHLREIRPTKGELRAANLEEYPHERSSRLPKRLQEIIRSLWPSNSEEEVTWDFEWKSFPLRGDNTREGQNS